MLELKPLEQRGKSLSLSLQVSDSLCIPGTHEEGRERGEIICAALLPDEKGVSDHLSVSLHGSVKDAWRGLYRPMAEIPLRNSSR